MKQTLATQRKDTVRGGTQPGNLHRQENFADHAGRPGCNYTSANKRRKAGFVSVAWSRSTTSQRSDHTAETQNNATRQHKNSEQNRYEAACCMLRARTANPICAIVAITHRHEARFARSSDEPVFVPGACSQ